MTGATSFTGAHICRAFGEAGFRVTATLTRDHNSYSDPLIRARMAFAAPAEWIDSAPVGSGVMLNLLQKRSFETFVNHGGDGIRSKNFDGLLSVHRALEQIHLMVPALKKAGVHRVLHSGSVFEPREQSAAVNLYGVSKSMIWEALRFFCEQEHVSVSKIVIPEPVGALEGPEHMMAQLVKQWKEAKIPLFTAPHLVRDHLPATWLARVYVDEALRVPPPLGQSETKVLRPSGYTMRNEDFLRLFVENVKHYCGIDWTFAVKDRAFDETRICVNSEPCDELRDPHLVSAFWVSWLTSLGLSVVSRPTLSARDFSRQL